MIQTNDYHFPNDSMKLAEISQLKFNEDLKIFSGLRSAFYAIGILVHRLETLRSVFHKVTHMKHF